MVAFHSSQTRSGGTPIKTSDRLSQNPAVSVQAPQLAAQGGPVHHAHGREQLLPGDGQRSAAVLARCLGAPVNSLRDFWDMNAAVRNVSDGGADGCISAAASSGCFSFDYPSTQQQMLVWKARPQWCALAAHQASAGHAILSPRVAMTGNACHCTQPLPGLTAHRLRGGLWRGDNIRMLCCSVMVLKKLGSELREEFLDVIDYLGRQEGMQVRISPSSALRAFVRPYLLLRLQAPSCHGVSRSSTFRMV